MAGHFKRNDKNQEQILRYAMPVVVVVFLQMPFMPSVP